MSHFHCEQCGLLMIDSDRGYINGCEHYRADVPEDKLSRREKVLIRSTRMAWERDRLEAVALGTD